MKKNLLKWICALLIAIVGVSFVSCGDDDDEKEVSILGTWRYDWSDEDVTCYSIMTFFADGTGNLIKKDYYKTTNENFKYVFDAKTMTLILMFWADDDGDYTDYEDPVHISSLTSTTMVMDGYTFYKQ